MVGSIEYSYPKGVVQNSKGSEEKVDELRRYPGKGDGDLLKIVGVGAGAWGSDFAALLQDSYGFKLEAMKVK
ncbi:6-phosphogluconate dehydrogenase family protein [Perilla frutescens var. hirtella]|nr:6-phosphogluconate dehydrogenase family protein [Perilla frutescens var. hirtella]